MLEIGESVCLHTKENEEGMLMLLLLLLLCGYQEHVDDTYLWEQEEVIVASMKAMS